MTTLQKTIVTATVAVLAGVGVYEARQSAKLREENKSLQQQTAQLIGDNESLSNRLATIASAKPPSTNSLPDEQFKELLRLRGQVGVLRNELMLQKRQANPQPAPQTESPKTTGHAPGLYITMDQLVFAGYETPEAALESMVWATLNGTYDQAAEALGPELMAAELRNSKGRERFEAMRKETALRWKGIQILSKKTVADDRVELKVILGAALRSNPAARPPYAVQPMIKVGDQWKVGGSTRPYDEAWERDGQIQTFAR